MYRITDLFVRGRGTKFGPSRRIFGSRLQKFELSFELSTDFKILDVPPAAKKGVSTPPSRRGKCAGALCYNPAPSHAVRKLRKGTRPGEESLGHARRQTASTRTARRGRPHRPHRTPLQATLHDAHTRERPARGHLGRGLCHLLCERRRDGGDGEPRAPGRLHALHAARPGGLVPRTAGAVDSDGRRVAQPRDAPATGRARDGAAHLPERADALPRPARRVAAGRPLGFELGGHCRRRPLLRGDDRLNGAGDGGGGGVGGGLAG